MKTMMYILSCDIQGSVRVCVCACALYECCTWFLYVAFYLYFSPYLYTIRVRESQTSSKCDGMLLYNYNNASYRWRIIATEYAITSYLKGL
jgi:hypothetical protein